MKRNKERKCHNAIFAASLLSNLVFNCAIGTYKIKCKYGTNNEKCETCGIIYKGCECCLKHANVKDDLIEYKCLCCSKNYQIIFHKNLKKIYFNTYKYFNCEINKCILVLRKFLPI